MKTHVSTTTKHAAAPSASQLCKTKVQFLSDPQRLRRVAGGFIRVVKIGRLRLSPEKIGEDIAKKTVKNGKVFQKLGDFRIKPISKLQIVLFRVQRQQMDENYNETT